MADIKPTPYRLHNYPSTTGETRALVMITFYAMIDIREIDHAWRSRIYVCDTVVHDAHSPTKELAVSATEQWVDRMVEKTWNYTQVGCDGR